MSIVSNLQAHQLVLTKELTEINHDLVALQQMGFRYETQCGISFRPAVDHLVVLRAQKEGLLAQVNSQLALVQDSVASSTQLVNQMNLYGGGGGGGGGSSVSVPAIFTSPSKISFPSAAGPIAVTASLPPSAVQLRPLASAAASAAVHVTHADIVSSSLYGPSVVHIQGTNGLLVSTNSSILAHSPMRERN
jgi:hypothetical protein